MLISEPAGDGWAVERLAEAACTAGKQGSPESEAVSPAPGASPSRRRRPTGRRVAARPGHGRGEAGLADWAKHLEQAVDTAPNAETAGVVALVLGLALSRAQRFEEAVTVLDRAATSFATPDSPDLALALEAAAVVAALNDPLTALSVAHRRQRVRPRRGRARGAARTAGDGRVHLVLTNEARRARRRPRRPGAARRRDGATPVGDSAVVCIHDVVLAGDALAPLGGRYAEVRPLLDASIAQARTSGDSSRLAAGLAHRGWLAPGAAI